MRAKLFPSLLCLISFRSPLGDYPLIANVLTDQAPRTIGPYSQAVCVGSFLFVSGQIGVDPSNGKLAGETIEEQTQQVLKNLNAILATQGLTLEHVVKTEVYLKDLQDFALMNNLYAESFFYDTKPARAIVQVSRLPMDALIEISCIAYIPDA